MVWYLNGGLKTGLKNPVYRPKCLVFWMVCQVTWLPFEYWTPLLSVIPMFIALRSRQKIKKSTICFSWWSWHWPSTARTWPSSRTWTLTRRASRPGKTGTRPLTSLHNKLLTTVGWQLDCTQPHCCYPCTSFGWTIVESQQDTKDSYKHGNPRVTGTASL